MNKKQSDNDNTVTTEAPELEDIFNFDKEVECWKGQYKIQKKRFHMKDGQLSNKKDGRIFWPNA